ncbi:MAG: YbcC family protein, partial [Emticicia sp.]
VHPLLFRILCSYLDQGISIWRFPDSKKGFLASIREIEQNTFSSFFKNERAKKLLLAGTCTIEDLLMIVVEDKSLFNQYIFDQQFAHQGWSGMVSAVEDLPQTLLDRKKITLKELIIFELLLEIDALDTKFGENWTSLKHRLDEKPSELFNDVPKTELSELLNIWQDAFEWTYYDQVLAGVKIDSPKYAEIKEKSFQAMFCIDDRECSIRRYLEKFDENCKTYGTAGFFGVEFFYKPVHANSSTKQCPAPVTPKYLIKEEIENSKAKTNNDIHFGKHSQSLFTGWFIAQTLGFWSAFRLLLNIFRPSENAAAVSSFKHMDTTSKLTIENKNLDDVEEGLQVGFTVEEMALRVGNLLNSIGLVKDFASIVYVVGHGASSVNNTHYAGYDCGACSGRPGSVNARVISFMANHTGVREILRTQGIDIPASTQFVGALHDTTRDEIAFYDKDILTDENKQKQIKTEALFIKSLDFNAKERSRRFESIDTKATPEEIHARIRIRAVSLFEPRPELNHATNALCLVGRREMSENLFLDRRSFMNSFDYEVDPEGKFLVNILNAVAPVCGGINLEYYFSRVDNHKLGAGSKLPHNVMGLFGVANGIDGDLRPGLPSQMIEVHDPIRLLVIVEHFTDIVLSAIKKSDQTYEWFLNEWIHLVVVNPVTKELSYFKDGAFTGYEPLQKTVKSVRDIEDLIESHQENFPVYLIK